MASADLQETETETPIPAGRTFLRRVRIRGYKSIAFCDVTLEPLTVLVGRNGCGKSNFLDALAFLRDAVNNDVREAVQRHGGWAAVLCRTRSEKGIEFEVDAEIDIATGEETKRRADVTYRLRVEANEDGMPSVAMEYHSVSMPDGSRNVLINREPALGKDTFVIGSVPWENSNGKVSDEFFKMLERAISPEKCAVSRFDDPLFFGFSWLVGMMRILNPEPKMMRKLGPSPGIGGYLEKNGANLSSVVRQFAKKCPDLFERAKRYVNYIVREVVDFETVRYGDFETVRFLMNFKSDGKPVEFDASSMSDGTLRAIACIIGVFYDNPIYGPPSLVGIEEPETSLHPGAMNGLVDALDEATLATQVIITTHSTELLDNPTIQPHNIRVVEMVDGRTIIGPLDEASVEIIHRKLDTLGGLERQNQLGVDLGDRDRQLALMANG